MSAVSRAAPSEGSKSKRRPSSARAASRGICEFMNMGGLSEKVALLTI